MTNVGGIRAVTDNSLKYLENNLEQFTSNNNKSGASNTSTGSPVHLTLESHTEYDQYADQFQAVSIFVIVGKQNGTVILNLESRDPNKNLVDNLTRPTNKNVNKFQIFPGEIGTHIVNITAIQNGNVAKTSTTYNVISF